MAEGNFIKLEAVLETKKVEQGFKSINSVLKKVNEDVQQHARKIQRTMLSVGLSFLFTGMAIKRMADTGLRAIFNTMSQVMGDTSEFSILTNRLSANWEFFKFQLVDALMQSGLFQNFIGFLIDVIKSFQQLSPEAKRFIVLTLVGLSFIGGAMMIFGQSTLALIGLIELLGLSGSVALGSLVGKLFLLAAAVIITWNKASGGANEFENVLGSLAGVLIGLSVIAKWMGVTALGAWALAIGGALLLGLAFKEELGILFGFLIRGFIEVGSVIMKMMVDPLTLALKAIIAVGEYFGKDVSKMKGYLREINQFTSLSGLKAGNDRRIQDLIEQRKERPNIFSRLGFLPTNLFPEAPTLPESRTTSQTQSAGNTLNIGELNIQTGAIAETGDQVASEAMSAMKDQWERELGSSLI